MSLCFFNHPAPTECYTYWHTRSLHDALRISRHGAVGAAIDGKLARAVAQDRAASGFEFVLRRDFAGGRIFGEILDRADLALDEIGERRTRGEGLRSEEHTSELQSLMRISYAVFCLKKQILTQTTTQ